MTCPVRRPGQLRIRRRAASALLASAVVVAACGVGAAKGEGEAAPGTDAAVSGELVVFAAASLTDVFDELADTFEAANPDVEVVVSYAGSQTLASQINEGAPADVFAAANTVQMERVAEAGNLATAPEIFAANVLAIAVEPGNPRGIEGLADLAAEDLLLVLPAAEVPAGRYAREALDAAGIEVAPVSLERDVRAALAKVELGEADAAIVYASDLAASDAADAVPIPPEQNVAAAYPIAVVAGASNPTAAAAFVAAVRSEQGQEVLTAAGFVAP